MTRSIPLATCTIPYIKKSGHTIFSYLRTCPIVDVAVVVIVVVTVVVVVIVVVVVVVVNPRP